MSGSDNQDGEDHEFMDVDQNFSSAQPQTQLDEAEKIKILIISQILCSLHSRSVIAQMKTVTNLLTRIWPPWSTNLSVKVLQMKNFRN